MVVVITQTLYLPICRRLTDRNEIKTKSNLGRRNIVETTPNTPGESAHHEEDHGDSYPQPFLDIVDVVPRVADAEVEHHGRDRGRHQVVAEGFPHLRSRPDKNRSAQEPYSSFYSPIGT